MARMVAQMSFGSRTRSVLGGSVLGGDDLGGAGVRLVGAWMCDRSSCYFSLSFIFPGWKLIEGKIQV